jgi:hypothetical protein
LSGITFGPFPQFLFAVAAKHSPSEPIAVACSYSTRTVGLRMGLLEPARCDDPPAAPPQINAAPAPEPTPSRNCDDARAGRRLGLEPGTHFRDAPIQSPRSVSDVGDAPSLAYLTIASVWR